MKRNRRIIEDSVGAGLVELWDSICCLSAL